MHFLVLHREEITGDAFHSLLVLHGEAGVGLPFRVPSASRRHALWSHHAHSTAGSAHLGRDTSLHLPSGSPIAGGKHKREASRAREMTQYPWHTLHPKRKYQEFLKSWRICFDVITSLIYCDLGVTIWKNIVNSLLGYMGIWMDGLKCNYV